MPAYDQLLSKLLEKKPDLTKEGVEQLVQEKKDKIGAGYLTDQGAIFLIASDLGVSLEEAPSGDIALKDLYVGAKEVSLQTRVMSLSPAKQYSRKDGSPFMLRTMTVYDSGGTASVKLWDEKANLPGINELKPGDLVKIIKAYVKADLNGAPTINIGSGSSIEPTTSSDNGGDNPIPLIDTIIKDPGELKEGDSNVAVSGTLDGIISPMSFTSSKGRPGTALRMTLRGRDNVSLRVVLWGKDESSVPKIIGAQARIKMFGVSTKQGMQGLEIHGNDSTSVVIDGQKDAEPVIARIISSSKSESGDHMILGVDRDKNMVTIVDTSDASAGLAEGDIIECMPSKAYGNAISLDSDSFVRKLDDDPGIPTAGEVRTKVADLAAGEKNVCIESIILKKSDRRDIQTKNGETVSLSDMLVGDDGGEVWVKGWRNQARLIDACNIGEVVSITGLSARPGMDGRVELTLGGFSKITVKDVSGGGGGGGDGGVDGGDNLAAAATAADD